MNVAEWILVVLLSVTLFIFLVLGCVLLAKLIGLTKEAQKIVEKGQDIADNANDVVENVKGMTSIGGVVKTFADQYAKETNKKEKGNDSRKEK
ncbi:hypothetical protein IJK16_01325 [Candidatus Saccharibacteria bacterium]|nr:hypothetical protein [Candidatus Saccharibacteria bacterium]